MISQSRSPLRAGTVLILVAGLSALLASTALVFLMSVRGDVEDMSVLLRETQSRIMLTAACNYIQEASRLGWEAAGTASTEHTEAFGWIDVRDGGLGPRATTGGITPGMRASTQHPVDVGGVGNSNFPIGVAVRFPMHVLNQAPYAIQLSPSYNPVQTAAPDGGQSYLRYPDPQPVTDNGWAANPANPAGPISSVNFAKWAAGDPTPRQNSFGMAWFRLVREATGSVFTVTCGSGGTQGYRTWAEVQHDGATQLFNNDPAYFTSLIDEEVRMWYRVEWNASTTAIDLNYIHEYHEEYWAVATHTYSGGGAANPSSYAGAMMDPNMGGTIQWIQRLRTEPVIW